MFNRHRINVHLAVLVLVLLPVSTLADQVPENLALDHDTDFIGCLVAVDDATINFRDALQEACSMRVVEICMSGDETSALSQTVRCLNTEVSQAIAFLEAANSALPAQVEKKGFFGHRYQTLRQDMLQSIAKTKSGEEPTELKAALSRLFSVTLDLRTLFRLVRETDTPVSDYVSSPDIEH